MRSKYYDQIHFDCPMNEYPRPQMKRNSYLCLNGAWDYTIKGKNRNMKGKALVPFSLESELGGGIDPLKEDEMLIMERSFVLPENFNKGRVLLHLDGCDASCDVFVNGKSVGSGSCGYLPVQCDLTSALEEVNHLKVIVHDPTESGGQPRGKQSSNPKGIWYTAQSGLWQTVWLESVPEHYIESIQLTPHFDEDCVEILVHTNSNGTAVVECDGQTIEILANQSSFIVLNNVHPWSVDDPYLYDIKIRVEQDIIESYFGMRKFSIDTDEKGIRRLFLNNKPYFHTGLLDQGYMSDTLMS